MKQNSFHSRSLQMLCKPLCDHKVHSYVRNFLYKNVCVSNFRAEDTLRTEYYLQNRRYEIEKFIYKKYINSPLDLLTIKN